MIYSQNNDEYIWFLIVPVRFAHIKKADTESRKLSKPIL